MMIIILARAMPIYPCHYLIQMRNTLPLSSLPLQVILAIEQYYHLLLATFAFFLVLFKTYNLPYTGGMAAQ
jgi:hypothetical protein